MESENPAQLPVVQETQAQPPSGQPIIYQMAPGQQQPVFIQVPTGQPATTSEGQPIQYYYVPVGQPPQPGQSGQPVFVQGAPGQPAQTGQPVFIQGAPGQPGQSGQPVFIQGAPGQPVQPQKQAGQGGFELNINTEFLKSPPCFIKIAEFVSTAVICCYDVALHLHVLRYNKNKNENDIDEEGSNQGWCIKAL